MVMNTRWRVARDMRGFFGIIPVAGDRFLALIPIPVKLLLPFWDFWFGIPFDFDDGAFNPILY